MTTLVLSVLGALAAAAQPSPLLALPRPLLTVARAPRPPVIDGKLRPGEWQYAGCTAGLLNLADGDIAAEQTTVYVTYDAQRLYVAFEAFLTTERSPRASESRRDGGVWGDESFELFLVPAGQPQGSFYHFIGNSIGTVFDRRGTDKAWNGDWRFANDAGMGRWTGEIAIDLCQLGAGDPTGQTWAANFARNAGAHTSWSFTGRGYSNPQRFGAIQFGGETNLVRVARIEGVGTSELAVAGEVFNPTEAQRRILLGVRLPGLEEGLAGPLGAPGVAGWRPDLHINLSSRSRKEFRVTRASPDAGRKVLVVGAATLEGKALYGQAIPFTPRAPQYVSFAAHPSETAVFVRADLRPFRDASLIELTVRVTGPGQTAYPPIRRTGLRPGAVREFRHDVSSWPEGDYTCQYRLASKEGGRTLSEDAFAYERRPPPTWYTEGREIGREEKVLPPWTPIRWSPDTADVWGRTYSFDDSLLLRQVTSAGEELLRGPAEIRIETKDGRLTPALTSRRTLRQGDAEGVFESSGLAGPVAIRVRSTLEFDGLVRFDVKLTAPQPTTLRTVELILPFASERTLYYHYCSSYYARSAAAAVPPDGLRFRFKPFVWLGDNRRGLMWCAADPRGWHASDRPIEIRRTEAGTDLVVHLVEHDHELGEMDLTFALQATPVKPVPPDWRAWRADRVWPSRYAAKHAVDWEEEGIPLQWRYLWWTDGMRRVFSPGHTTPLQVMDSLGDHVREWHKKGTRVLPYMYLHGVNRIATGFDRYYPVWQTSSPKEMAYYGRIIMGACAGSGFADYLLYGIRSWVREHGADGVYFDGAGPPVACANALHGHGWVDDRGRRRPSYPIFGLRSFYKRLWSMLTDNVEDPAVWVHADGKMASPCFSFATANWEGEMTQGAMKGGDTCLSELLPLEYWRAHMLADQWGVVPMWLFTTYGTDEQRLRQQNDQLALLLVHGTPMGRTAHPPRDVIRRLWGEQHAFGIGQAEFHGYWENAGRLRLSPAEDGIVASTYRRGGRVMIAVANFRERDHAVELQFLGADRPADGPMADCLGDGGFELTDGRLTLPVGAHSFRLVRSRD